MSVIEDSRQVIQDLVVPELESLEVKLSAVDARITGLEASVTQRFTAAEMIAAARHDAVLAKIAQLANTVAANQEAVNVKLDLNRRIERVELFQRAEATRREGRSASRTRSRSAS